MNFFNISFYKSAKDPRDNLVGFKICKLIFFTQMEHERSLMMFLNSTFPTKFKLSIAIKNDKKDLR